MTSNMEEELKGIAKKFGIDTRAAANIWYLRTRSRWTQEKEDYLIRLAREGKPHPNIMEDFKAE